MQQHVDRLQRECARYKQAAAQSESAVTKQWTTRWEAQKQRVAVLEGQCRALQSEKEALTAKLKQKQHDEAAMEKTNALQMDALQRARTEREAATERADSLQKELERMAKEHEQRRVRMEAEQEAQREALRAQIEAVTLKCDAMGSQLTVKENAMKQLERRLEVMEQSNTRLMAQNERMKTHEEPMNDEEDADEVMEGHVTIDAELFAADCSADSGSEGKEEAEAMRERMVRLMEMDRLKCDGERGQRSEDEQIESVEEEDKERESERQMEEMKMEYEHRIETLNGRLRKLKKYKEHKRVRKELSAENERLKEEMQRMREMDWRGQIVAEYVGEDGQTLYDMKWDVSTGMTIHDVSEEDLRKWKKHKKEKKRKRMRRQSEDPSDHSL